MLVMVMIIRMIMMVMKKMIMMKKVGDGDDFHAAVAFADGSGGVVAVMMMMTMTMKRMMMMRMMRMRMMMMRDEISIENIVKEDRNKLKSASPQQGDLRPSVRHGAPVVGLESTTEGSLHISRLTRQPLSHRRPK
ncbi:hypothetical protein PoB_002761600 [Plakobranchus ocellatus]|uniref:Uncharacterized protein n=1 Tax=Plakobranchus ocellatus TaxID=259542 RepID=A0AAV4A344_9GAST|nr:hypothetical protein PoB_002761600 [Plakobranchus ocellatus]